LQLSLSAGAATAALCVLLCSTPTMATAVVVHPGDQLLVRVYGHPELSEPVTVNAADQVSLPLAGTVDVHGLGMQQIAERIRVALVPYVIKPAVEVELKAQPDSIFVSGGPGGVIKYQPGETLSAALADLPIGGSSTATTSTSDSRATNADDRRSAMETSHVDTRRVAIERDGKTLGTYDVSALSSGGQRGPNLLPGDTIVLVDKPVAVRVSGDVRSPGVAHLWSDEALSDAITQSGGLTTSAATSHITLQRDGTAQSVSLGDPIFTAPATAGETLTVASAPRVVVAGLVTTPGPVTLKTNFSLLSALYAAGGPTQWADLTQVQVIGANAKSTYDVRQLVHGDVSQNPDLKDGDVVFVPEGHKVDSKGIFQTIMSGAGLLWLIK
jgi:protein involved in polysaccharide export with SLBB domain